MLRPIGKRHSPNYQHVVLMNWSKRACRNIGREGYAGLAIYVEPTDKGGNCAFVIEGRGEAWNHGRMTFAFNTSYPKTRRVAFRRVRKVMDGALT